MNLREIVEAIDGRVLCCEDKLDEEVRSAYASDLMSDVLAFCTPGSMLITGLTNIQIVRTAQMLDLSSILFVRGKTPQEDTVKLAQGSGIPIILCGHSMYKVCGELYKMGVPACHLPSEGE
jgi:predicted transcriptional regulator